MFSSFTGVQEGSAPRNLEVIYPLDHTPSQVCNYSNKGDPTLVVLIGLSWTIPSQGPGSTILQVADLANHNYMPNARHGFAPKFF